MEEEINEFEEEDEEESEQEEHPLDKFEARAQEIEEEYDKEIEIINRLVNSRDITEFISGKMVEKADYRKEKMLEINEKSRARRERVNTRLDKKIDSGKITKEQARDHAMELLWDEAHDSYVSDLWQSGVLETLSETMNDLYSIADPDASFRKTVDEIEENFRKMSDKQKEEVFGAFKENHPSDWPYLENFIEKLGR